MSGQVFHKWNGTILTITSDAGTSSVNLKGAKGDRGVRGVQGRSGVILDAAGDVDMTGYATEQYVDEVFSQIEDFQTDLSNYYTAAEIDATLENYTNREYVADAIAAADISDKLNDYYKKEETYSKEEVDTHLTEIESQTFDTVGQLRDSMLENMNTLRDNLEDYTDEEIAAIPRFTYDVAYNDLEDENVGENAFVLYEIVNEGTPNEIKEVKQRFIIVGGSGGGSSNNAVFTLMNTSDWLSKSISQNSDCYVSATWSSTENEISTGAGVLTVTVNGIVKHSSSIAQGDFSLNIAPYLSAGGNTVRVSVKDVYGNLKSIVYTVKVVSFTLESTFNASIAYEGDIRFTYTPTGDAVKTVHFVLDGSEIGTAEITASGRQQSYTIPTQSHGSHTLEVWFTATVDGSEVESNHLFYDLICIESNGTNPIIACQFNETSIKQYETVNILYTVYNPASLTSNIVLSVNGDVVSELNVDRTEQIWSYRANEQGELILTIACGDTVKTIELTVTESFVTSEAVTDNLELWLSSYGRSNNELNPAVWSYEDISCYFSGYNWKTDGWQLDDDGITVHRVTGNAILTIPFKMFKEDFRTNGKTIEIEFATRDVRDYDAEILSCMSGGIGLKMTAQQAILKSEQSTISTQYKEDEHIRLTFVVEKKAENRLVYIYLNGIMCGAVQYPEDDDFSQGSPVNIYIGSSYCTIDLYNIRVYNKNLTRFEVLDNWIADTQDVELMIDRFTRNNVYDAYGNIVISQLPSDLPYMVLEAEKLPEYKGNKLSVSGSYVNPVDESKSFAFENAEADVQGTSSAGYARKNYKITFENGITQNGESKEAYKMRDDSIATDMFTFKADVASSEGANNVELVRLYNRISPYKTPPQETNASVRQGIDGFPIVMFHNDGVGTSFIGKYNFNNDKGTPEVFGFSSGDESWEIKNNTSNRVLWKSADFSGTDWTNDFEARYPDKNMDTDNLARFAEWVVSTDREQATNEEIEAVTIGDVEYTSDTAEYRLAKFKAEIEDYAELQSALFYYLFTELFLMVDSRAKNAFPSLIGGDKICWLPYDMDTANGTNNEGDLVFGYELEDTDVTETGADVYNGQKSVFWCNIRDAFYDELAAMYQELRSDGKLSYDVIEKAYEEHQAKWCEAIWNEDAYYKYLEPLIVDGSGIYLPMLQGSKSEQRKWWLYNRFRYIDSKYVAGDSLKDFITLRGYAKSNITLEPYADIYASIKYGSYMVQERALKGSKYTLACPLDNVNDTEIYIYSASQLKDVGDLSGLKVGLADFSSATRLQSLKLGDSSADYDNSNLVSLTLGNNVLLNTLDVRNCSKLGTGEQQSIDVSGCSNIEHVFLDGTAIKSIKLPDGGILKTLHLPDTVTSLKVCNQTYLTDFVLNNPAGITSLRIENTPAIDSYEIFDAMNTGARVRLTDIDWTLETYEQCMSVMAKMDAMRGLDEDDGNVDTAQISGKIGVPKECYDYIESWEAKYPNIDFETAVVPLEQASWDYIARYSELGLASEMWDVGDEKTVTLSTGEVITVVIYGFNHDDLSDGSGKASITFGMKDCLETKYAWDATEEHYEDYAASTVRSKLKNTVLLTLPEDLQAIIKPVTKYSYSKSTYNDTTPDLCTVNDALFLFSPNEVFGGGTGTGTYIGTQYEYFATAPIPVGFTGVNGDRGSFKRNTTGDTFINRFGQVVTMNTDSNYNTRVFKGIGNNPTATTQWWSRMGVSTSGTGYYGAYYFHTTGGYYTGLTTEYGVSFGFCI